MHAQSQTCDAARQAAIERLHELKIALEARKFLVRVEEGRWSLVVKNQAAQADDPYDPLVMALGPVSLSQRVVLGPDNVGGLWWHWEWDHRGRDTTFERIAPAAAVAEVTERIARVLALAGQQ